MQRGSEDFIPNGLLSTTEPFVNKVLDKNRWSKAEARIAQLLAITQPNPIWEAHRNALISYLQILFASFVPCQVFAFGSVPLKTYLADGDIDLTVFADERYSEDRLVQEVLRILETEQKNELAPFLIQQVQFIQAEVKIIKCVVGKFVVDISFKQISGIGTLCFLEEVNFMIKQSHLLKRSIILIKAWCYYESRIMGSQHGLLSTYALETLVMYIFHLHNNTFAGPFEVLYRFLNFFSKFDWKNYCISLRGPVPISTLPNVMRAEPPLRNCQDLLFSEEYLKGCEFYYGPLSGQEVTEKPFASKHINIVDPLLPSNNLGRSISKGNFSRIKSAIALGAKRVERILSCPEDNLIDEVDLFFRNTWERNENGSWIDAHSSNFNARNNYFTSHESAQASHGFQGEHTNTMNNSLDNRGNSNHVDIHQSLGQNPYDWMNVYAFDENAYPVNEAVLTPGEEHHVSVLNQHVIASMNMDQSAVFFQPPPPPHVFAPGYMHEDVTSFESLSGHNTPYSYGTGPFHAKWFPNLGSAFYEAQFAQQAYYNMLIPHSDHQRQMSVEIGSNSRNSSRMTGADNKWFTRGKHSGNSHYSINKNKNVKNSSASSSSRTGSSPKTHQPHGVSGNRIGQSTIGTDFSENTSTEAITSQVQALQLGENLPMTLPNSSVPGHTPVHVPSSSSQRAVDNQSLLPVSDGSSGSSFQVPTMVPFYMVPTETGTSIIYSSQSSFWNSAQHVNQTRHDAETYILDGDIPSCFWNLHFGRLCKNPRPQRPLPPPSNTLPLRKQFPLHRKPTSRYFHTPHPVMPSQHASSLIGGTIENGAFWLPYYSDGTGSYMPNPVAYNQRYYKNKHRDKIRFAKIKQYEKKRDKVEMAGSNESSDRGESSRSGNSEVANFGRDSKSSSEHQPSS